MVGVSRLTGVQQVIGKMRGAQTAHSRGAARGLMEGGKFLFIESQAIVPVDQGHLKGSGFVRRFGIGFKTDVVVGYTADYAVYVHEDLDALHGAAFNAKYSTKIGQVEKTMRGENQQAKFLEQPAREKRGIIIRIVAREMRKG